MRYNLLALLPFFDPPTALWRQVTIIALWLGFVVLVAEVFHRVQKADAEQSRKIVHIGVGNIIALAWWLQIPTWLGVGASVLFSGLALLSYRLPLLPSVNSVGRKSMGTFFYAVSFGVLIGAFWSQQLPHYAALGILVMTWGDGLAALIGQRWGKHPYQLWGMKKSWEGSLTMLLVSYAVSSGVLWLVQGDRWQTWVVALGVAIAATLLEAFSKYGVDNLTVPLGSAVLAFLCNEWLFSETVALALANYLQG